MSADFGLADQGACAKPGEFGNISYFSDRAELTYNPQLYTRDALFHAAYALLDRAYIIIDEDLEKRLIVSIMPKSGIPGKKAGKEALRCLAQDFSAQLISSMVYREQLERTAGIREILLKKALEANNGKNEKAAKKG